MRSIFGTFRGAPPREEPAGGIQLHQLEESGVCYLKIVFRDSRDCKIRLLRYTIFEEFKRAAAEQRIRANSSFHFQLDNVM